MTIERANLVALACFMVLCGVLSFAMFEAMRPTGKYTITKSVLYACGHVSGISTPVVRRIEITCDGTVIEYSHIPLSENVITAENPSFHASLNHVNAIPSPEDCKKPGADCWTMNRHGDEVTRVHRYHPEKEGDL